MRKLKSIFLTVLIVTLCFILFLGLMEIIFRMTRGTPNPLADVTQTRSDTLLTPNEIIHNRSSINGEFETTIRINSLGYRGHDFSVTKPQGSIRILAIGDSFTFGVGANDDQTIPAVMAHELIAQGYTAEVINAGIGHESPIRHWDNLERLHLKYHPDIVLLFFDLTDLWDDWHWERHAVWNKQGMIDRFDLAYINGKRDWWATLVQYSAFCKWFDEKGIRMFEKLNLLGFKKYSQLKKDGARAKAEIINSYNKIPDDTIIKFDGLALMRGRERSRLILKHWDRTTKYLSKIRDLLAEKNIPFIIVMYPHGIYVGEDQWNEGRKTWGFEQNKKYTDYYPFELMDQYTKKAQIPFINTLSGFLTAPKQKYFHDWDGHMTAAGYKLVAEQVVANAVFQNLLKQTALGDKNNAPR
ncbi:MAG: SGNH/GDSL hydrolase family protein [Candidatus Omnitrophica bacterium]|nr:SGNH/GDSL hydrolase family protein [Candidatus Omnitrophota bacterium]